MLRRSCDSDCQHGQHKVLNKRSCKHFLNFIYAATCTYIFDHVIRAAANCTHILYSFTY